MKNIVRANDKITSDVDPRFYLKCVLFPITLHHHHHYMSLDSSHLVRQSGGEGPF